MMCPWCDNEIIEDDYSTEIEITRLYAGKVTREYNFHYKCYEARKKKIYKKEFGGK